MQSSAWTKATHAAALSLAAAPLALGCESASSPADSAPTVALVSPNGGEFAPTQEVAWRARDADDGDELSISLVLETLDASDAVVSSQVIAEGLENTVGVENTTFAWPREDLALTDLAGSPVRYRMHVVATDLAGNETSDGSDAPFTLLDASALEGLDWDDVGPIFLRYCGRCHREPAAAPNIAYFRLDKYNSEDTEAPSNDDLGVFEMQAAVTRELFTQGGMPPLGNAQPGELDKMRIENWLAEGAILQAE